MKKNYKTITILIFALTLTYSMSFAADEDYKKLESDNFIIYYHWWDAGFAKRALGWLEDIRTIAKNELGYSHDSKFKVYSPTKLKGNQPDWVSGRYYREDVAFQVLSPSSMKRAVSFDKLKELTYHEYMHSIVHLAMKEHYLPNKDREYWQWLNEGIAMYFASFKSGMKWDPGNYKEFLELIRFNKILHS